MRSVVTVEEVAGGKALARFTELPHAVHGDDPRFAPMVMAWERYRLDRRRNPYFETGDGALFLARRLGRPVGRIAAHIDEPGGEGRFGSWWVDDDRAVAAVLVEAARGWLGEQGCTSMEGPYTFARADEAGVQVAGHEVPGLTGRPWHPPHLAGLLEELGFEMVEDRPTWRLPATERGPELALDEDLPGQAGAYADPRLVLEGIAAVPDLAPALRTAGLRSAWSLAKRARAGEWDTAVVVRCTLDAALVVPALQAAAGRAGYKEVIAPWSPEAVEPETVHRTYRLSW
ncbi:MAG: hypothetical protein ACRDZU_15210 [Acidimicrobiales bacterium]